MSFTTLPAYLVEEDRKKICPVCHEVFDPRRLPSLSKAFRDHFMTKHRPGKKASRYIPGTRRLPSDRILAGRMAGLRDPLVFKTLI